jgi:predicted ATP-dependent endonuclease of OLD family
MSEILISDEEKEQWFMGDIALDRAEYERRIEELEKRLKEIDRHTQATIDKVKAEHEKELEAIRQTLSIAENQVYNRDSDIAQLKTRIKRLKDDDRKVNLIRQYEAHIEAKLEEASKEDPIRLITELENAKMMMMLLHDTGTRNNSLQDNNLMCAIREYAKSGLKVDVDDYNAGPSYREMIHAHIRDIWQPHKTVTGAWTKDADPSLHPFCGIVGGKDGEE